VSILRARKNPVDERFVMINAWNDWANGAYLEPDDRFGYAYLAACGSAISEKIQPDEAIRGLFAAQRLRFRPTRPLAVVLHLFYEDLAEEFAGRIAEFGELDIYLTVTNDISPEAARRVTELFPDAYIQEVANRGRDMLPFVTTFDTVREGNHRFVCKLHTKRSSYLRDGNAWRDELVTNLLSPAAREALRTVENLPKVGVVACKGSLAPLANESQRCPLLAARIQSLAARKGLRTTLGEPFVAGSMFWFRPEAMVLFSSLTCQEEFEPELGQIEGTLAHALERLTVIAAREAGYDFAEIEGASVKPRGVPWASRSPEVRINDANR
jgi:lipopolysaccharide biosynthesis protein